MSNNKSYIAEEFLITKLKGDAQLTALVSDRIYADVAPTNPVFPFVTIRYETYSDVETVNGKRPIQQFTYLVVASGKIASYAPLQPILERIDAILDRTEGKTTTYVGTVISCTFDGLYKMPYVDESGVNFRDIGNRYSLIVQ